jgi:hypothetical protein
MLLKKLLIKKNLKTRSTESNLAKNIGHLKEYRGLLKKVKQRYLSELNMLKNNKNRLIKYIITVKYYRTGVSLTASTIRGDTFLFCLSKQDKTKKKHRINRKIHIKNLTETLTKYCPFLLKTPVALHLIDVGFDRKRIVKEILTYFFILVMKVFDTKPYNGCRRPKNAKKKIRSKKTKYSNFSINTNYSQKQN